MVKLASQTQMQGSGLVEICRSHVVVLGKRPTRATYKHCSGFRQAVRMVCAVMYVWGVGCGVGHLGFTLNWLPFGLVSFRLSVSF